MIYIQNFHGAWGFSTKRMQFIEAHVQKETYTEGIGKLVSESFEWSVSARRQAMRV